MRESIGGTMIFWIVLFLFSIFIAFISFIIKYARVYKIKNTIVNYITRQEGVVTKSDIDAQLNKMEYQKSGEYRICRYFPSDMGEFYYIELYSETELPLMGSWLSFRNTIKGETRVIKRTDENVYSGAGESMWFYGLNDQCFLCTVGHECRKD